jgi:hypothetical protein
MRALAQRSGVAYISMVDLLCDAHACQTWAAPGVPLQFDYGHFTRGGSVRAADLMMPAIERALAPQWDTLRAAPTTSTTP